MIYSSIFGFLIGLIIVILLNNKYIEKISHGPKSNKYIDYIFKLNNKYYKYQPRIIICPLN